MCEFPLIGLLITMKPFRVVVLGGGVSGLCVASTLVNHSKVPCQISVIERQHRVGGWLRSTQLDDGTVFEHGPRSARAYGPQATSSLTLLSRLGLGDTIIGISKNIDAAKRRYIYVGGKMNELPTHPLSLLFRRDPFSKSLLSTILKEWYVKKGNAEDESVYSFFSRRFNDEVAKYLCDPLCRGIFGGDAKQLSLKSCFKLLHEYESQHGSVLKGMLINKSEKTNLSCELVDKAKRDGWLSWSLEGGMETLSKQWKEKLESDNVEISLNNECKELRFIEGGKVSVLTDKDVITADAVISTIPVCALAPIIKNTDQRLCKLLQSIRYVNIAVTNLQYKNERIPFNGFGFLVPSCEPVGVLGMTFDSLVLPHTAHGAVITVMAGGSWFDDVFPSLSESAVTEHAVKNVRDILDFASAPSACVSMVHRDCIPQYHVGHEHNCLQIDNYVKSNNLPVLITGTYASGVGVNDAIMNAHSDTLRWLAARHMY